MKKFVIGFLAGAIFATVGTAAASGVLEKVTATVRTDYTVELDGKKVTLKNSPLAYNGASYLPVREVSEMLDKEVDFKDGVIKLDTPIADPAAELERLEKNAAMVRDSVEKAEQSLEDDASGAKPMNPGNRQIMEESLQTYKDALKFYEDKIAKLKERYPELEAQQ